MKTIGNELLKKCRGLPLAIIVLGGLLAVNGWETVSRNINSYLSDKSDVSKVLALSYDDLPWHLKPCFLYLGGFPENAEIPTTKVLYMWIAEGFVLPNAYDQERQMTVEDVAERYLMELVRRGMVQARFNLSGKIKTCRLHDMMRDVCVSKARQERFISILNIQQDDEMDDCYSLMARKVMSSFKTQRVFVNLGLSVERRTTPRVNQIGRTMPHRRTLMFFGFIKGMWEQFRPIFIKCKFLRVLKLEDICQMGEDLPESVGDLVHLRYLSLAESVFQGLPQSMGNLVYIEFLDLHVDPFFEVTVPNVLWKMRRLRYLHLPFKFAVKREVFGYRKKLRLDTLKNLRTLKNFCPKNSSVNDISKLTNLQRLTAHTHHCSNELEIIPRLAKFTLKHLRSSSFRLASRYPSFTEGELSRMSSYCHSCKLSVSGAIDKLPGHKNLPQQLRKLVLISSRLEEDPMPILEKMDHLVVLLLCNAFVGKKMICSARGFPRLKH